MKRLRHAIAGTCLMTLGAFATGTPAIAEAVIVEVDRATILRLDAPAGTIILGNPAIADALVQDQRMVVITGKSYGSTNLIVLDADGQTIEELTLHVRAAEQDKVTVQRGTSRVSFSCAPVCERTLMVGDTSDSYNELNAQIQSRIDLSQGQAGNR